MQASIWKMILPSVHTDQQVKQQTKICAHMFAPQSTLGFWSKVGKGGKTEKAALGTFIKSLGKATKGRAGRRRVSVIVKYQTIEFYYQILLAHNRKAFGVLNLVSPWKTNRIKRGEGGKTSNVFNKKWGKELEQIKCRGILNFWRLFQRSLL